MSKLIVTRGVPASGKSTWAKAWVAEDPDRRARVNRDDIRFQLFGLYYGVDELAVSAVEKATVRALLDSGKEVVVDATNLRAKFARDWYNFGVPVEWQDFPISFHDAINRDNLREAAGERWVGEDVIRKSFFERYSINYFTGKLPERPRNTGAIVQPVFEPVERDNSLPPAIIVDIDGTLAHMVNRGPYDTSRCADDAIDRTVRDLVNVLSSIGYKILVTSGRDAEFYPETRAWLQQHNVAVDRLIMREQGDKRRDDIVKNELFETYIRGNYNVWFSLDDRDRVVDMWRAKGIKTLQVERGDF